jgi:hypothetical protein
LGRNFRGFIMEFRTYLPEQQTYSRMSGFCLTLIQIWTKLDLNPRYIGNVTHKTLFRVNTLDSLRIKHQTFDYQKIYYLKVKDKSLKPHG